jgi:hypothetical protein
MATVILWRVPGCLPGLPAANLPSGVRHSGKGCGAGRVGVGGNSGASNEPGATCGASEGGITASGRRPSGGRGTGQGGGLGGVSLI